MTAPVAGLLQLREHGLLVLGQHDRARRHLDQAVRAVRPGPVLPHAVAAAPGLEVLLIAVVDERIEVLDADDDDVATLAAVTAVRAAELDELLAPEAHAPVAAVAGLHVDLGEVEELHAARLQKSDMTGRRRS